MFTEQELVVTDSMKELMSLGAIFAASGMFVDTKTQAQAVVKIIAGRELGLSPIESMTNIFFINNRRSLTSAIMASLLKKGGKYDYTVEKLDTEECILEFFKIGEGKKESVGKSQFTFKDAAKAGLVNKANWQGYPRNCLFARALANGVRWYTPDAICGYVVEEMEDLPLPIEVKPTTTVSIDAAGEVISGESKS